jgi:predicted aspartyl protease
MRGFGFSVICSVLLAAHVEAEVPLTKDTTRHVTVPAFVNGKGPFPFVLDTGADGSAVYAWFAKANGLPKSTSRQLSGATGSVPMTGSRVSELRIDGHAISNVDADTIPDRPDRATIAGVAGVDVMMGRLAVIDFGCGTFALGPIRNPGKIAGADAQLVNAGSIPDGKQLTLPVTVNGVAGVAMLDSGSRASIVSTAFARAAGVDFQSFRHSQPTRGAVGSAVTAIVGSIGTVCFAGVTRKNVVARVADLPALKGTGVAGNRAMILGLELMEGTRLTIDYSARRFWFAKSSCESRQR